MRQIGILTLDEELEIAYRNPMALIWKAVMMIEDIGSLRWSEVFSEDYNKFITFKYNIKIWNQIRKQAGMEIFQLNGDTTVFDFTNFFVLANEEGRTVTESRENRMMENVLILAISGLRNYWTIREEDCSVRDWYLAVDIKLKRESYTLASIFEITEEATIVGYMEICLQRYAQAVVAGDDVKKNKVYWNLYNIIINPISRLAEVSELC